MAWIIKITLEAEIAKKLGKLSDCKFYLLDAVQDSVVITLAKSRAKVYSTLEAAETELAIREAYSHFPGYLTKAHEFEILEVASNEY